MNILNDLNLPDPNDYIIGIIGLGYVGLPLAIEIAKVKSINSQYELLSNKIIAFDVNALRVDQLKEGFDSNQEVSFEELKDIKNIDFTYKESSLYKVDILIVTVPTPVDEVNLPDLSPLENACKTIGYSIRERNKDFKKNLKNKTCPIIIFESTVFPGATEEVCIPIIEKYSGLQLNEKDGFVVGYSPERINPGDKNHKLSEITKVTSGSNPDASIWIDNFYKSFITAGTYRASSIKVAEACKIIENTQRDLNIALVNEFAIIFHRLGIDTLDVIEAASTKWNFLKFKPGLVGGHCIGVDPYYLAYKAKQTGYYPYVVLAGRRINDQMGEWIVDQVVLELAKRGNKISNANVLVLGFTFKENCTDIRNTRIPGMVHLMNKYRMKTKIFDPWINAEKVKKEFKLDIVSSLSKSNKFDLIIVAIAHNQYLLWERDKWESLLNDNGVIFDLKGIVPREINPIRI